MFRKLRSNVFMVFGSPLDKYMWSILIFAIPCVLNAVIRDGDSNNYGILERYYENFYNFFYGNHFMIYVVGHMLVAIITYWTIGGIYTIIDEIKKPEISQHFKLQADKISSTSPPISKCVLHVFYNFCWTIPFTTANYLMLLKFGDVTFRTDQFPSFFTLALDMIVNSTALEIGFYYGHRILHYPLLYKHIHKKHHEYVAPIAISFFYTHPIEHVFGVLTPFMLGQYVRHTHVLSSFIWVYISIFTGLTEHCGYHFPLLASTEFHDYHHVRFNQNFGLVGLMDWIHGTSKDFSKSIYRKRHFSFYGATPLKVAIPDKPKESKKEIDNNANNFS